MRHACIRPQRYYQQHSSGRSAQHCQCFAHGHDTTVLLTTLPEPPMHAFCDCVCIAGVGRVHRHGLQHWARGWYAGHPAKPLCHASECMRARCQHGRSDRAEDRCRSIARTRLDWLSFLHASRKADRILMQRSSFPTPFPSRTLSSGNIQRRIAKEVLCTRRRPLAVEVETCRATPADGEVQSP